MKRFILTFRHLIVLIWIILILLIFKITTSFKFENGSSLVFISLLLVFPIFIYTFTTISKRKLKKNKALNIMFYFDQIKQDITKDKFNNAFLKKLDELSLTYKMTLLDHKYLLQVYNHEAICFEINITKDYLSLRIANTQITYFYYYSNKIDEFTKYDIRNFQYKDTSILYIKVLERIKSLINQEYIYIQSNKIKKLTNAKTQEVVYEIKLNKKIYHNLLKQKEVIKL